MEILTLNLAHRKVKVKIVHILTVIILEIATDRKNITIGLNRNAFDSHIYIWPWLIVKVKVGLVHIPTGNILEMVKDMAQITIAIKYEITCRISISISAFDLDSF